MGVIRQDGGVLNYQCVDSSYGSVLLCRAPDVQSKHTAPCGPGTVLRASPHPQPKGNKASPT